MIEKTIATTIHGRYLACYPQARNARATLVGFHGYAEDAETQIERLRSIPGSEECLIVSIQGLHRFYHRRSDRVVASWMTRQNREFAIADNVAYVLKCMDAVTKDAFGTGPWLLVGFSQGVAMAFRAAAHAGSPLAGVIAAGGDVPPELTPDMLRRIPAVLVARGSSDAGYTEEKFADDQRRLHEAGVSTRALRFKGGHEWPPELSARAAEFREAVLRSKDS